MDDRTDRPEAAGQPAAITLGSQHQEADLAPGWVTETVVIWTQFPARKGILDLSNRSIRVLPEELYRMRKLEQLIMTNNLLTEIPGDLAKLAEAGLLRTIDCSHNRIHSVHAEIAEIQTLETIRLSHNQLSHTFCFHKLPNLVELDLSYNLITDLNDNLCSLIFLEILDLSHNQIRAIPPRMTGMTGLKSLKFSHNQISKLPKGVEQWKRLVTLHLDHNNLSSIPDELGFLITLDTLTIDENPFHDQPEIHAKQLYDRSRLIHYLRTRIRADESSRMLLFTEKDNSRNTRFEILEGDEKPTLTGATPEKLAVFLTQVSIPDAPTLSCVEKCYSYFTRPFDLLWLFILRYKMLMANPATSKEGKKVEEIIQGRIVYVIVILLKQFNVDQVVYPSDCIPHLRDFIENIGGFNARHIKDVLSRNESVPGSLLGGDDAELAKERTKRREKEEKEAKKHEKDVRKQFEREKKKFLRQQKKREKMPQRATTKPDFIGLHLLSYPSYDIALQLCLLDSEKFFVIPETEFLHQKWTKPTPHLTSPKITECIEHFNNLSNWVVTWVVRETNLKSRVRTINHLLDIAADLFELGDFSALFAIGSAMSCAPVTRLKETFALVDEKHNAILENLHRLTDNTGNYKHYKELLKQAVERGHAVPHLAIYLKNFTFTEEGNPNYVEESDVINLGKFRFITMLLDDIAKMQPRGFQYLINADPAIQQLVLDPSRRMDSSDEQYEWSLQCEASKRRQPALNTSAGANETKSAPFVPLRSASGGGLSTSSSKDELPDPEIALRTRFNSTSAEAKQLNSIKHTKRKFKSSSVRLRDSIKKSDVTEALRTRLSALRSDASKDPGVPPQRSASAALAHDRVTIEDFETPDLGEDEGSHKSV